MTDNVSLQAFVKETLLAISIGVSEAQDESRKRGAIPIALNAVGDDPVKFGEQLVRFLVLLEANKATKVEAGATLGATLISVVSGKAHFQGSKEAKNATTHTVEFSVPIHFNSRWPTTGQA